MVLKQTNAMDHKVVIKTFDSWNYKIGFGASVPRNVIKYTN